MEGLKLVETLTYLICVYSSRMELALRVEFHADVRPLFHPMQTFSDILHNAASFLLRI
jgi:hypothetical protein